MTPDRALYGTTEPPAAARRLAAGPLAVLVSDGAVRGVFWRGVEVLRGIDCPVRDENWGTWPTVETDLRIEEHDDRFAYARAFTAGPFAGRLSVEGRADGTLDAALRLEARQEARVCRAGFVVLHPVAGVAGSPLAVTHSDGTVEQTGFPTLISPSQPVFDIARLVQRANGIVADIAFSGEVFEMEDQRNWSDASYKTYCRPLSRPFPYAVPVGAVIGQRIVVTLGGEGSEGAASAEDAGAVAIGAPTGRPMPGMALALAPGWEAPGVARTVRPAATFLRLDLHEDPAATLPRLVPSIHGDLDLELVVPDARDDIPDRLAAVREALAVADLEPVRVTALPAAYLKSYQPDGEWPAGATPAEALAATRSAFPRALIGGGMLTNFTELNRHPDGTRDADFVTHGSSAVVHAADDLSVMQTLESLPQILASAEAIAGGKPYRLGLVSIGMRSNPYGAGVADNPDGVRRAMVMDDPRQRGLYAAAWMVGVAAATEASRIESLALAAPAGPFGLAEADGRARPAFHVVRALSALAGRPRLAVTTPVGVAAVAVADGPGQAMLLANLSAGERSVDIPAGMACAMLDAAAVAAAADPDWLPGAARLPGGRVKLPPFAVAFVADDIGAFAR